MTSDWGGGGVGFLKLANTPCQLMETGETKLLSAAHHV